MKRLLYLLLAALLVLSCLGWVACGGGGEKTEEPTSESPDETVVADKGDESGGSEWEDIPIYSGATRHESEMAKRMSATMGNMGDKGESEIRLFKAGDEYDKVVSYYKSQMPRKGWEKIMEKEEEAGWGSMWQKKDGEILVNLTVMKDMEGECGIAIGRHMGKK